MAGVKALIPLLVGMMLLTGACNTLFTKYQDMQCVRNCDDPNPKRRERFEQPVIQTLQMFIGEMGCWLVVGGFSLYQAYFANKRQEAEENEGEREPLVSGSDSERTYGGGEGTDTPPIDNPLKQHHPERLPLKGWKIMLLALPAVCDIAGTTLMNVGLLFVAASIYQMTRGALILFVGMLSVIFLRRHLGLYKWFALFVVVSGVALVGLAGAIETETKTPPQDPHPKSLETIMNHLMTREAGKDKVPIGGSIAVQTVIGVLLIAGAQIFTATQFVVEESIMEKYALEPLKVVGWEGIWGFLVTLVIMIIMHFAVGRTDAGRYGYFDAKEGLRQLTQYRPIAVSSILIMISIGGFNFFGLSITRSVSATARSIIDTCRTLIIWIVSLGLGWETFKWLQVAGFALVVYGTFLFNDLVRPPFRKTLMGIKKKITGKDEDEELLPERPIVHQ